MDPWLNANAQSPLVRSLNTIATKSESFVHNIPDNLPPTSFKRIVITPYQGSNLGDEFRFRIPQYGFLEKVIVRLNFNVKFDTTASSQQKGIRDMFFSVGGNHDVNTFALRFLSEIQLITHNRPIQRMYAEELEGYLHNENSDAYSRNMRMSQGYIKNHVYSTGITATIGTWDVADSAGGTGPTVPVVDVAGGYVNAPYYMGFPANYEEGLQVGLTSQNTALTDIVHTTAPTVAGDYYFRNSFCGNSFHEYEIPFAVCSSPHLNLQTRFVEDLEIVLTTLAVAKLCSDSGVQSRLGLGADGIQLILQYHNFHENVEQTIRNENYQPGVPASLLLWDSFKENMVPFTNVTTPATITVPIRSNNCAYAFTVVMSRKKQLGIAGAATGVDATGGYLYPLPTLFKTCRFTASGVTLWEGNPHEMKLLDMKRYHMGTRSESTRGAHTDRLALVRPLHWTSAINISGGNTLTSASYGAPSQVLDARLNITQIPWAAPTTGGVITQQKATSKNHHPSVSADWCFFYIAPNFQFNETVNTGSFPLQTLANPALEFDFDNGGATTTTGTVTTNGTNIGNIEVTVIVHYRHMTRIDSDTGIITRSLDL